MSFSFNFRELRVAGSQQITRVEGCDFREKTDHGCDVVDHRVGLGGLLELAVDPEFHPEIMRIGDFIFGGDPGADGRKGVKAFAHASRARKILAESITAASGDIEHDRVAEDGVERVGLC